MTNELEETIENTVISVVPASNYHLNKQRAADALARLMGPSNQYMAAQKAQSQRVASGDDEIAIQLMMQGFAVGYEPVETPEEVAMQLYARVDDPKAEQEMQNLLADYFRHATGSDNIKNQYVIGEDTTDEFTELPTVADLFRKNKIREAQEVLASESPTEQVVPYRSTANAYLHVVNQ